MPDPRLARALIRWQHAAGPYWPYVGAAPFLADPAIVPSPTSRNRRPPHPGGDAAVMGQEMPAGGEAPGRLGPVLDLLDRPEVSETLALLADLPIEPMLAAAPQLARRGWYVVPVLERWVAEPAVLPSRRLLHLLMDGADRLARPRHSRGVVLLADGERAGVSGVARRSRSRGFDNRYAYQTRAFPPGPLLRSLGVRQLRWACPAGIATDLAPYARDLVAAGLTVDVVSEFRAGPSAAMPSIR